MYMDSDLDINNSINDCFDVSFGNYFVDNANLVV